MATNPLIISTVLAIILVSVGLKAPEPVADTLNLLGDATVSLGLICAGAALDFGALRASKRSLAWGTLLRLVVMPAVAVGFCLLLGLRGVSFEVAMLCVAAPVATSAYHPLAPARRRLHADGQHHHGDDAAQPADDPRHDLADRDAARAPAFAAAAGPWPPGGLGTQDGPGGPPGARSERPPPPAAGAQVPPERPRPPPGGPRERGPPDPGRRPGGPERPPGRGPGEADHAAGALLQALDQLLTHLPWLEAGVEAGRASGS